MELQTVKFGNIKIEEDKIFDFELPIIGFDNLKKFVILDLDSNNAFKWLQSTEDLSLAFPIVSLNGFDIEYTINLTDNIVETLKIEKAEDVLVMNITSIPQNNPKGTTINMLAPVIFNVEKHIAGQIVLTGSGYDINYPMFKDKE